jgi:hypothetical protein
VQGSESILGPIQQATSPIEMATSDPSQQQQEQQQQQQEQKKEKGDADDSDDGSNDASLGLINSGPVQLKNNLEQPVTSGGMDTNQGPGPQD